MVDTSWENNVKEPVKNQCNHSEDVVISAHLVCAGEHCPRSVFYCKLGYVQCAPCSLADVLLGYKGGGGGAGVLLKDWLIGFATISTKLNTIYLLIVSRWRHTLCLKGPDKNLTLFVV